MTTAAAVLAGWLLVAVPVGVAVGRHLRRITASFAPPRPTRSTAMIRTTVAGPTGDAAVYAAGPDVIVWAGRAVTAGVITGARVHTDGVLLLDVTWHPGMAEAADDVALTIGLTDGEGTAGALLASLVGDVLGGSDDAPRGTWPASSCTALLDAPDGDDGVPAVQDAVVAVAAVSSAGHPGDVESDLWARVERDVIRLAAGALGDRDVLA